MTKSGQVGVRARPEITHLTTNWRVASPIGGHHTKKTPIPAWNQANNRDSASQMGEITEHKDVE